MGLRGWLGGGKERSGRWGEGVGARLLCVDRDRSVTFSRGRSLTHVRV